MHGLTTVETIGLIVVVVLIASGASYWESRDHIRTIRGYLESKGVLNIVITWDWLGGDRGNQAFKVEYIARNGQHHQTHCKISGWSGEIYWRDLPPM